MKWGKKKNKDAKTKDDEAKKGKQKKKIFFKSDDQIDQIDNEEIESSPKSKDKGDDTKVKEDTPAIIVKKDCKAKGKKDKKGFKV